MIGQALLFSWDLLFRPGSTNDLRVFAHKPVREVILNKKSENAYHVAQIKRYKRKLNQVKYLMPVLLVLLPLFIHLAIFVSFDLLYAYVIVLCSVPIVNIYYDGKIIKQKLRCWYPEKMFKEDIKFIVYVIIAGCIACFFTFIPLFIIFNFFPSIEWIIGFGVVFGSYLIVLPIAIKIKEKQGLSNSIAKKFKQPLEKLEPIIKSALDNLNYTYEEVSPASSIWKNKTTEYVITNVSFKIETSYGVIRFKPVRKNDMKIINKIRKQIDYFSISTF